ncbi:radical SAM protein [Aquifex pyrophilus]
MRLSEVLRSELNTLFLFELEDRYTVESVFYRGDTLCVSTQVGCGIRCPFCASGKNGLIRNLTADEIFGQYELLKKKYPIRKIAVAGIGEPLMNWKNVREAFFKFKERGLKVSFYTTGFPTKHLKELLHLPHSGLTISLHATDEKLRKLLIPHGGSLKELINTLKEELPKLSKRKRNKVSLAYLLLKGVNDSERALRELAGIARELGVGITLLYYNKTFNEFRPVSPEEYEKAFLLLRSYGIRVTLSTRFRRDKLGGCGTLVVNRNAKA